MCLQVLTGPLYSEVHSEPWQTCKMVTITESIFAESSILDLWQGSKYALEVNKHISDFKESKIVFENFVCKVFLYIWICIYTIFKFVPGFYMMATLAVKGLISD